jgi:hypothetical protein
MTGGMLRLLIFLALMALLAPVVLNWPGGLGWPGGGNPLAPSVEGREVVIQTDDLEVRFDRAGPVSETYMLFGGSDAEMHNSISNVFVSGLAIRHASFIAQRYPKFYMCSSPGAAQAKQLIEDMALIAADGSTRNTLKRAVALHADSVASGGDRTCLRFQGEQISLRSAKHREGGFDLTREFAKGYRQTDFFFVNEAEISDCKALL